MMSKARILEYRDYLKKIVTDAELDQVWGEANFGDSTKRDVIKNGLLKCVGRWHQGHTSRMILTELGLITKGYNLTNKGSRYVFSAYVTSDL